MKTFRFVFMLGIAFVAVSAGILHAQECQIRVLQSLTDDLGNHWAAGKILPVDIERDSPSGGAFCASGGCCLPRVLQNQPAVKLLNCSVGKALGNGDWALAADASKMGAKNARDMQTAQNVEKKLSSMGFSNASAGGLANDYVYRPHSVNGRLVARVLAGSSSALTVLRKNNP